MQRYEDDTGIYRCYWDDILQGYMKASAKRLCIGIPGPRCPACVCYPISNDHSTEQGEREGNGKGNQQGQVRATALWFWEE